MSTIPNVDQDGHVRRIVAEYHAGLMTVEQAVQLALATGRLQGHYMSSRHLAHEAGIVREFNATRNKEDQGNE